MWLAKLGGAFVSKCVERLQLNELLTFVRFVHNSNFYVGLVCCSNNYVFFFSGVLAAVLAVIIAGVTIFAVWYLKHNKSELCSLFWFA